MHKHALIFAVASTAAAALATAPAVAADFSGKTVSLYIGYGPGGGYDLYGRLAARHMGNFLPGKPTIVAKNMPGAGGLKMTNWLYNVAPKDGTAIASAPQALAVEQALGSAGIQYDARRFTWIGRVTPIVEVSYTWHTSGIRNLDDARKRETIMGGSGPTSPTITHLKELNAFAGTKFKPISGFKGSSEVNLAMERGEVHGATKSWAGMKVSNRDWLEGKKVNILVQYAMERAPDLPNVPAMVELGKDENAKKALRFLAVGNEMGRTVFAPPGLKADVAKAMRDGFDAMMKSKGLQDEAAKRKMEIGALDGAGLEKLVAETLAVTPDIIAIVKTTR